MYKLRITYSFVVYTIYIFNTIYLYLCTVTLIELYTILNKEPRANFLLKTTI